MLFLWVNEKQKSMQSEVPHFLLDHCCRYFELMEMSLGGDAWALTGTASYSIFV